MAAASMRPQGNLHLSSSYATQPLLPADRATNKDNPDATAEIWHATNATLDTQAFTQASVCDAVEQDLLRHRGGCRIAAGCVFVLPIDCKSGGDVAFGRSGKEGIRGSYCGAEGL